MRLKFETISPTQAGGAVQFSVEVDLPDDASDGDIVEKVKAAFEAHRVAAEAQREFAISLMSPEQQAVLRQAEQAVMEQPRPLKMATTIKPKR